MDYGIISEWTRRQEHHKCECMDYACPRALLLHEIPCRIAILMRAGNGDLPPECRSAHYWPPLSFPRPVSDMLGAMLHHDASGLGLPAPPEAVYD